MKNWYGMTDVITRSEFRNDILISYSSVHLLINYIVTTKNSIQFHSIPDIGHWLQARENAMLIDALEKIYKSFTNCNKGICSIAKKEKRADRSGERKRKKKCWTTWKTWSRQYPEGKINRYVSVQLRLRPPSLLPSIIFTMPLSCPPTKRSHQIRFSFIIENRPMYPSTIK